MLDCHPALPTLPLHKAFLPGLADNMHKEKFGAI